jgi:hypothetical protein
LTDHLASGSGQATRAWIRALGLATGFAGRIRHTRPARIGAQRNTLAVDARRAWIWAERLTDHAASGSGQAPGAGIRALGLATGFAGCIRHTRPARIGAQRNTLAVDARRAWIWTARHALAVLADLARVRCPIGTRTRLGLAGNACGGRHALLAGIRTLRLAASYARRRIRHTRPARIGAQRNTCAVDARRARIGKVASGDRAERHAAHRPIGSHDTLGAWIRATGHAQVRTSNRRIARIRWIRTRNWSLRPRALLLRS